MAEMPSLDDSVSNIPEETCQVKEHDSTCSMDMPPSEDPYLTEEPSCEDKEKSLTCSVCLELFSEPKVLPCCHTFCLKCLEKTARSTEKKGEIAYVNKTAHDARQSGGMKKSVYSAQKSSGMEKMAHSKLSRGEMVCLEKVAPSCSLSSEQQRIALFQDPKHDVVSEVDGMARDMSTKRGEIVCPQCRETHTIPAGGLTELLTDFIASHEIEVKNLTATQNSRGTTVRLCGECEESVRIDLYCCDCQHYLCCDCIQIHKKFKSFRGHTAIPIEDLDAATLQSSQTQYCTKHKSEPLKLFCNICQKVVCRDCTLLDHRQHDYMFAEDARKEVESKVKALSDAVGEKLQWYNANLKEIEKVERSAVDYSEVLKADINTFFDNLARSVEARRQQLLMQAEAEGQNDMKQVWADKNFHETTISRISSVFNLINKAHKCTSDVKMILTALQGIQQLTQIKEMEWDKRAFAGVVTSPSKFTDGLKMAVSKAGDLERSSGKTVDWQVCSPPVDPQLGSTASFTVKTSGTLVDGRSGEPVYLFTKDLQVVVKYGKSQKPLKANLVSQSKGRNGSITVNIRLVCGGKHTVIFNDGQYELTKHSFSFSVKGQPKRGDRVKQGPDYEMDGEFEGTVQDSQSHFESQAYGNNPFTHGHHTRHCISLLSMLGGMANAYSIYVNKMCDNGPVTIYKWSQHGIYEVELI